MDRGVSVMVAEVDYSKCNMCGGYSKPICVENCPNSAITQRDKKIMIIGFLCEDCNECGFRCPFKAISIKKLTF